MASWDFIQKQVLIGDAACGKSSLLVRLTDHRFLQHSEPTIGVEFGSRIVEITEGEDRGKRVKLQIWDTAGQESFRAITRSYYRGAGGALLVFSLTSHASFSNCAGWLADLRAWGEEDLLVLLVGNKGDISAMAAEAGTDGSGSAGERREVEREEAEKWAQEEGLAGYVETSAKSGEGVEEAFNTLTRLVHARSQASHAAHRARKSGSGGSALPSIQLVTDATSAVGGKCC